MATNFYQYFAHFILLLTALSLPPTHANSESENAEYKTVKTTTGAIRGLRLKTLFDERPYTSFKGIPFAKAPLGELRFMVSEIVQFEARR